MTDFKPILCLDFDGVIHSYEKGWQGGVIYGTVTPGFFEWAQEAQKFFKLVIYSSRSKTEGGVIGMSMWMHEQLAAWRKNGGGRDDSILTFEYAREKPPAFLTIDDRALTFRGSWAEFSPVQLREFEPWTAASHG